ncbi:MAG: hypothetical protein KA802_17295, partial [Saprospiraceae bacterium]|nr:hypothetical protein [Saprospiraceae bacterium]
IAFMIAPGLIVAFYDKIRYDFKPARYYLHETWGFAMECVELHGLARLWEKLTIENIIDFIRAKSLNVLVSS